MIKILIKREMTQDEAKAIVNEVEILKILNNNENIIKMHDAFQDNKFVYLIYEHFEGLELYELIAKDATFKE